MIPDDTKAEIKAQIAPLRAALRLVNSMVPTQDLTVDEIIEFNELIELNDDEDAGSYIPVNQNVNSSLFHTFFFYYSIIIFIYCVTQSICTGR